MTQIKLGSEEYRRLLNEWSYWDRKSLTEGLTAENAERLKVVDALLEEAELTSKSVGKTVRK